MTAPVPPSRPQPAPPTALLRPEQQGAEQQGAEQQGPEQQGPARVAAALGRLEGVHQLPLHEQPDVYQAVHTELQNALAAIDHA